MRNNFGIRRRFKNVALSDQAFLQFEIIFNDAVVDNDKPAGTIPMGMSIFFRRAAMCRPPRMPDSVFNAGGRYRTAGDFLLKRMDASNRPSDRDGAAVERGNSA